MKVNRHISKGGGITLPASMRRDLSIQGGEQVEVAVQPNGDILLHRTQGACIFTGSEQNLITYNGRFVSAEAIADMLAELPDELRNQIIRGASDPT